MCKAVESTDVTGVISTTTYFVSSTCLHSSMMVSLMYATLAKYIEAPHPHDEHALDELARGLALLHVSVDGRAGQLPQTLICGLTDS